MNKNNLLKQSLVFGIIFLFIGVGVVPSTSKLTEDISALHLEYNKEYIDIINNELQESVSEEPPGIQWIKTFGGENFYDWANEVQTTADGGYILVGMTRTYGSDHYEDGWLIKTDANGVEEWNETYGEPGALKMDFPRSVQQTADGGYVFTGSTRSYNDDNDPEVWLVKTDANGTEEWNETYGYDRGFSVQQTIDGGYIVTGDTHNASILLVKTHSNGSEAWRKTFWGYPGAHGPGFSVDETTDGGFVLTGPLFYEEPDVEPDVFLVKTDSNGVEEFNVTFGGEKIYARGTSVRQTDDGGYIISGYIHLEDSDDTKAWLIKTDANGTEEWNITFGETNFNYFGEDVHQTADGGYVMAGYYIDNHYKYNSYLIKTDAYGNKEWATSPSTKFHGMAHSVDQTVDGGYILTGKGSGDALLIKIASEDAPRNPKINGTTSGEPGEEYEYTVVSTDPNDDQIYYWIDWGDGNESGWLGPFQSGEHCEASHNWTNKGTYVIRAKAKDTNDLESGWGTLEVTMPKNQQVTNSLFLRFLERFPRAFPIIRQMLPLAI